jgi:hypothetical protein
MENTVTPITIGIQLMALFVVFLLLRSFLRKTVMEKEEVEEKEIESIELPTLRIRFKETRDRAKSCSDFSSRTLKPQPH